jgi:predicted pyridoxine 5'-phosphate oxidase superfamily flavin-nucleotide-binding protein
MLPENFIKRLEQEKYIFISFSTSDLKGNPNSAYKLLIKIEGDYLYLFDYPAWKTWKNLKQNPKVSMTLLDERQLKCYKIAGTVEIIEEGAVHENMREAIDKKRTDITTKHIIEAVRGDAGYGLFEDQISEKFVLYKVKVGSLEEVTFAKTPGNIES